MPAPSVRTRAAAALQWLGLPGVILLAAVVCDLLIIIPASVDPVGPKGADLVLLPGVLVMAGCALWARVQPVTAAWAGAAALVFSTTLIYVAGADPYTALLSNLSFTETVAGFELVYFCVSATSVGLASVSVSALVVAALLAVFARDVSWPDSTSELVQTMVGGLVLLVFAVVLGWQRRKPAGKREQSALVTLLREQWPLVGGLIAVLFLEMFQAASAGVWGLPVLMCSAAAAVTAVTAMRRAVLSAVVLAGLIVLSTVIMWAGGTDSYQVLGGIPPTQVLAGAALVVSLVRYVPPGHATGSIGLLSAAVAAGAIVNAPSSGADTIRAMFIAALLLLGIAVAIGLYLKARDSERVKTVEAAVTDAQTSERMALARELHDVVAHHVTGIVVQAQAARMLGERDPRVVVDALGQIEDAGTEALIAMRRLVRSMRGDAPAGSSEFSEQATTDLGADLRRLAGAGNHGVPTEVDLDLPPDLPQEVARSALRIVQESLTNVGKHATGATLARVSAHAADGELHIRVSDNGQSGPGAAAGGSGGYGLIGMRERVELLRGRLSAGPGPGGGWLVEVWLPLEGETTE